MNPQKKKKLGRGLAALLGEESAQALVTPAAQGGKRVQSVAIESLLAGTMQPRRHFADDNLAELTASIKEHGVLQPLLVRPHDEGTFEIIAGERRFRAATSVGISHLPVLVVPMDDATALQVGLVENLQRQDLNPLEEAQGYARLANEFERTQEEIARVVGKSRPHVANMMRLLTLPDTIQTMLSQNLLTMGHARLLVGRADALARAQRMIKENMSVRTAEQWMTRNSTSSPKTTKVAKDADVVQLEKSLSNELGLAVRLHHQKGRGSLTIHYHDSDQLDGIIERLKRPPS